jgi:hypothetical protein
VIADEDGLDLPVLQTISTPTLDGEGLLRVGQQPAPPCERDVRSAPMSIARALTRVKVLRNMTATDSRLSGATKETIARDQKSCSHA